MSQTYEWAVLRVVPRVERGEQVNVGVVVYCRALDYLGVWISDDLSRAVAAMDATLRRTLGDRITLTTAAGGTFTGTLVSAGIFPDIKEPIRLQPDYALGFVLFLVTLALNFVALRVVKRFREAYE